MCSLIYILRNKRAKAPCSISIFSCLSHLPLENWLKFPVFYLFQIKVISSRRKRSAYTADRQPAATNTQITLDYMRFGIRHTCPTNAEYMIYFSFTKLPYNAITLSRPMMCHFLSLSLTPNVLFSLSTCTFFPFCSLSNDEHNIVIK